MSTHKNPAIEVRNLVKSYDGKTNAVDDLSFSANKGSIYALLGPNGAGKSTTRGVLTTMNKATTGTVTVMGLDVDKNSLGVRKAIGITFQELILDGELTGYQVMDFQGKLYGMGSRERKEKIPALLALVDLSDDAKRKCKTYSGGMKRRLELIRSLLTEPRVLFLDEPTQGLDPVGREQIWNYIRKVKEDRELTVVLTTHYLEEAYKLADAIGIIDHGKLVAEGSPQQLIASLEQELVSLRCPNLDREQAQILAGTMANLPWVRDAIGTENKLQIEVDSGSRRLAELITMTQDQGVQVEDVQVSTPDLSSVFLKYTGTQLKEAS
jgi:ABC-2 type transport system ATP-binding protein